MYTYAHPGKVAAYVGIAQISDMRRGARLSYEFALSEAARRGDEGAIAELRAIGPSLDSVDERLALGKWVERFGGVFHDGLSTVRLIWAALGTDEANLVDLVKFGQGNRFSLTQLEGETARLNLVERYRSFGVPIVFLLGRHDWHVPSVLAVQYFEKIEAPCKRLVWFERSAHNSSFEEPGKFNQVMIEQVLPLALGGCAG
jgi:pimeloyl-ACP methyl ester carboxylesterase